MRTTNIVKWWKFCIGCAKLDFVTHNIYDVCFKLGLICGLGPVGVWPIGLKCQAQSVIKVGDVGSFGGTIQMKIIQDKMSILGLI
ncbi:hypothetical protein HanPSC8_Chr09g0365891 [Helianthus annuus]|nr:hypothetical protein HanPSC8_Chr09g0365891 [Helianthus annuus]